MMSSISSSASIVSPKHQQLQHEEMFHDIYQNMSSIQMDQNMRPSRMSISHAKGLLNMPGQNNCFLNSAVQVLWHLDIFRRSFRELSGHACMADSCIFCALKELFNQFQYSEESALPPDALRFALAEAFSDQRRFQLGFMDDAAECFENILLRIHCHIANQDSEEMYNTTHCLQHCIPHQKFAMNLIEQIICHSCGATSEPFPFTQMVHYVSTPALCAQSKQYDCEIGMTFGELLKSAGAVGDIRDCPRSCGARIQIKKSLINKPDIVSIGLVWDSERPTINHIMNVFRAIGTTLRLPDVFDTTSQSRSTNSTALQLVGLVTYYGKHYSTFFFHTKLREWIYFDDATVRAIGPHWEQVVDKCIRGHFQPLLLLFANPNGTPVNTENAPKQITPLIVNKTNRRSYLSPLQAKSDITSNNYHLIPNMQRNGMQSTHISSDAETRVVPPIDKRNVTNAAKNVTKHLNGQTQHYAPQPQTQWNNNNNGSVKPLLSTLVTNPKPKLSQVRPNQNNVPLKVGSIDTLLKPTQSASSDVPDSPSARSSTSYFSDIGELDSGYISRKTVESVLNLQRHSLKKKAGNRNSSSSLESFDIRNGALVCNKNQMPNERICSLQRHDSGNSSGDRHSASSASVSSVESPYYTFMASNRRPFSNLPGHRHPPSPKLSSDQGYDSFSLSSTDSYPSVGGSSSPGKLNPRLKQIPEDVQLMELINTSTMLDCDKLCSEADVLLLKSHEKEREGDLRAAAALSDSAASKARSAMDAPYSNHQTLITAKMKHSMCVMRSASLHKRVKEIEAEEKRRIKAEQLNASNTSTIEYHHSRQSSRDSTHSKHSRQGSKDSKDGKTKELNTKHASLELNKSRIIEGSIAAGKTLELYATLPKKGSKKRILQQSLSSLTSLRIKNDKNDDSNIYKDFICKRDSIPNFSNDSLQSLPKKKIESKLENNKKLVPNSTAKICVNSPKQVKNDHSFKHSSRESDFSDYYSEWEATRRSQQPLQRTLSGSASCRENDSEFYGEVGTFSSQSSGKKQHRIRRKLLMGGFMKRKNRSLPDLREGVKNGENECPTYIQPEVSQEESLNGKTVAQISTKGFHQPHRAFISERGLYQRPSLLKVSPPLIEKPDRSNQSHNNNLKLCTNIKSPSSHTSTSTFSPTDHLPRPPTPPKAKTTTPVVPIIEVNQNINDQKSIGNSFLKELASKRAEIMRSSSKEKSTDIVMNQSSKEQINNAIAANSNSCVKSVLKTSLPKHNQNVDNDVYDTYDSVHYNPNNCHSMINQIANSIPKSISSQILSSQTHSTLHNIRTTEQTNDSSVGTSSVKDLASRFEKIMSKQEDEASNEKQSETLETNEQNRTNTHRIVALLATNRNEDTITPKQIIPTLEIKKPDDYSVKSNLPSPVNTSIPVKNCLSPGIRPNRPPDYQTAIKRIGMLRNDKSVLNMPQTRQFYMNASGNLVQQNCPRSPQIQSQLNESQKCVAFKVNSDQLKQQSLDIIEPNFDEQGSPIRKKPPFKKSVSFSDQVVLVACADEEEEEYLPNPILERILGKNSGQQSMQS